MATEECSHASHDGRPVGGRPLSKGRQIFGIDVRSLACWRIGLGLLILSDLITRLPDLVAHYSDAGVLPRMARISLWEGGNSDLGFWWSLHMLSGDYRVQAALFAVAAFFAVWLILGYRTRLATAASWILLVSLQSRNPMVLHGGDVMFRCLLFWSMFLPLGAVFSIDRLRSGQSAPENRILSMGTLAILSQLCFVYVFTALFKRQPEWIQDYTAVYFALHVDHFTTEIGQRIRESLPLTTMLSFAAFWLETSMVFLVTCPFRIARIRMFAVISFIGLHMGIAACMELGNFSWVMSAAWLLFLPTEFWDCLGRFFRPVVNQLRSANRAAERDEASPDSLDLLAVVFRRPESPRTSPRLISSVICLLLICYTLTWNVYEIGAAPWMTNKLPSGWKCLGHATYLCQRWDMFAPPTREDGWFVIRGTLRNGRTVNLWKPGTPIPDKQPRLVSAMYPNAQWRKYLMQIAVRGNAEYRRYFTHWISDRWNASVLTRSNEVDKVHIAFQLEPTPPPSAPMPEPTELVLWTWDYHPDELASMTPEPAESDASASL